MKATDHEAYRYKVKAEQLVDESSRRFINGSRVKIKDHFIRK